MYHGTEINECLIKVNATYEGVNLFSRCFEKVRRRFHIIVSVSVSHGFHNGGCIPLNVNT